MTDFEKRLEKAIQRGRRASDARAREEAEKALSEKELRRLHTQYRLELSEHIEGCLKRLSRHLPGFRFDTVVSDHGWGAAISRDDVQIQPGRPRENLFSRLELLVSPVSKFFVLELIGKGTIRNKECFKRTHFEKLADVDPDTFIERIDHWVLEYAELYMAKT